MTAFTRYCLWLFQSTLPARGATPAPDQPIPFKLYFNPRSPRGERPHTGLVIRVDDKFQSTLPARGATDHERWKGSVCVYFNPRSPRGERRYTVAEFAYDNPFQSTLPARGATARPLRLSSRPFISIHAPREGSDNTAQRKGGAKNISIHAPREGSDRKNTQIFSVYFYIMLNN